MVLLGYGSNGFPDHRWEEALPWLAELGYRAVALTPDVGRLDPRTATPAEVRAVGGLCRSLGLAVVLETGARFVLDPRRKHRPNLLEPDDSWRERRDLLLRLLSWCDDLGAGVLSFWSGVLPEGQTEAGARTRLAAVLPELAAAAEAAGVRLALEPEPGHFVETLADWEALGAADHGVGLTLDVGHLTASRDLAAGEAVARYGEHIVSVQLDDCPTGVHEHRPPGEGDVDWPAVRRALAALPPTTPACFELPRDGHRFHALAPRLPAWWAVLATEP